MTRHPDSCCFAASSRQWATGQLQLLPHHEPTSCESQPHCEWFTTFLGLQWTRWRQPRWAEASFPYCRCSSTPCQEKNQHSNSLLPTWFKGRLDHDLPAQWTCRKFPRILEMKSMIIATSWSTQSKHTLSLYDAMNLIKMILPEVNPLQTELLPQSKCSGVPG